MSALFNFVLAVMNFTEKNHLLALNFTISYPRLCTLLTP